MTNPAYLELLARYRSEPDDVLLSALTTGAGGYRPGAWRAISEEATRRGLTLQEPEPAPLPPEAANSDSEIAPLPPWLSATLLGLACLFLLLQVALLLAYYGLADKQGVYLGSTSSLNLGITAVATTRFVRVGPHDGAAPVIRRVALGVTAVAILARL